MQNYRTLVVAFTHDDAIVHIELNRPEIRNAFDDVLIAELSNVFDRIAQLQTVRAVVLSGRGRAFCAGADMHWMRRMKDFNRDENYQDARHLSQMLEKLYTLPVPTIAKVNGAAIGGGVGLVAACDIVVADHQAIFSLSEVRLGLVPACISPYLIARINPGTLRGYFLTGRRFDAVEAKAIGLVNDVASTQELDAVVAAVATNILACGPQALTMAKKLLETIPGMPAKQYLDYTAQLIADLRISSEGQEGLSAFLEKRVPHWQQR